MNKLFTVIVPMYNAEKTIEKALKSVENQTKVDLISEIIVVNDGSTDNSKSLVERMRDKADIKVRLINQNNGGVSKARNVGLNNSKTKWIAFLDSDDEWTTDKIEKQYEIIKNNDKIDFLGGNISDKKFKILTKELPYIHRATIKEICLSNFPQPSTVIFKKSIFDSIGGFDESQNYSEDQNYFLNICKEYNFYHIQEKLVNYGDGKKAFGDSGLSANLKEMHLGNKKNMKELYYNKNISFLFYYFLRVFNYLKYIRRKILVSFNLMKG